MLSPRSGELRCGFGEDLLSTWDLEQCTASSLQSQLLPFDFVDQGGLPGQDRGDQGRTPTGVEVERGGQAENDQEALQNLRESQGK